MRVIDSHTGGMPTRMILESPLDLGGGSLADQAYCLQHQHRAFRTAVLAEPRGQPGMVGALLVAAPAPDYVTGVIYFDSEMVLGMCGHGTIGTLVSLAYLGLVDLGEHHILTPVGPVTVTLINRNTVRVNNVASHRLRANIRLDVAGYGPVSGDLAFGGNWFFIVEPSPVPIEAANIRPLTELALAVRSACAASMIVGESSAPVDHVILQQPSPIPGVASRNFVLCPDGHYDRSPCGTGSSALLACLAADGRLAPGVELVQESVIGSQYRLSYRPGPQGSVLPTITGQAFVTAESTLLFADQDPFKEGICLAKPVTPNV